MDATNVAAVQTWPQPRSARGLRGFLGLSGYYRRFIKDNGRIAAPLTQLLRKEFHWSEEAGMAFSALKEALCAPPYSSCLYGTIAAPLTQLLHKEGFRWSEEAGMAFSALKEALCAPWYSSCLTSQRRSSWTATRQASASA